MKKTALLFCVIIMVFAFVSCNPDSASDLLPGEVTPPEESKRVSASDEEIKSVNSALDLSPEDSYMQIKIEADSGDDGKISITITTELSKSATECVVNGLIKIDGVVYKADNLILTVNVVEGKTKSSIESGKMFKDGTEMTAEEVSSAVELFSEMNTDDYPQLIEVKLMTTRKGDLLDSDKTKVGTGTLSGEFTLTADGISTVFIYDYVVNDVRIQAKIRGLSSSSEPVIDYIAVNGKFFDKESITKLLQFE